MDSFERIYAALQGLQVDRPPIFPQIGDHAGIINNLTYNVMYQDAEKAADAHLKALDLYGYDITTIQVEPSWPVAEACGATVKYPPDKNPWITIHPLNSEEDLVKLNFPDFLEVESTRVMIRGTEILAKKARVPVAAFMTGPITLSLQLMPYVLLITKMIKKPEFTHELVKYSVSVIKDYIKALKEVGATVLVVCEHDFQMLKPKQIKEFSLKYLHEIFEIYDYNILHMCGKISPHLNEIAHDLKQMQNLNTINIGPFVDISKTQKLLDHKIGVAGNIDHIRLLPSGTPNEIEDAVKKAIKASGGNPRYMVAPGCEITADTPINNVKALVNATKSYKK
ncbi:MAG: uroporphyrinogen decarboxylase family protein [Candidatus Hermodarchaeota archaeon]